MASEPLQGGNHSLEKARIRPEVWPVNFYRGGNHTLEKTRIRPEIWPVYRVGRQKWEVFYQPQGQKREVSHQPQGNSAPSLAARKGTGHYRVGQPNHYLFRIHGWVRGVIPLPSFQPTRCRVWRWMVHRGQPRRGRGRRRNAGCVQQQQGGQGGTPSQDTGGKILLNGWPPP